MSKPRVFEKPLGMRDLLPETVLYKKKLEETIQESFESWGYRELVTPTLEFFDTIGEASLIEEHRLFKLLDRSGNTLVLRPDMTAPIARVVSSVLRDEKLPMRLCYHGSVYRAQEKEAGRHAEFFQSGVELIGDDSAEADAEVIALAIECLIKSEVTDFKIAIGSMAFVNLYLQDLIGETSIETELKNFLLNRDYVSYRDYVRALDIPSVQKDGLLSLLQFRGGMEAMKQATEKTISNATKEALRYTLEIWETLKDYGFEHYIQIDLTLVSTIHYYTGMIFEGYATNIGFPICSGGRYDGLIAQFGRKAPATGFALKIDRVMEASKLVSETVQKKILVRYTPTKRREALAYARQLRQEAKCTVITEKAAADNEQEGTWDDIVTFGEE